MRLSFRNNFLLHFGWLLAVVGPVSAAELPAGRAHFIQKYCVECHDTDTKKAGLDLTRPCYHPSMRFATKNS